MNSNDVFSYPSVKVQTVHVRENQIYHFDTKVPLILFNPSSFSLSIREGEKELKKLRKEEMVFLFPGLSCSCVAKKEVRLLLFPVPRVAAHYFRYVKSYLPSLSHKNEVLPSLKLNPYLRGFVENIEGYLEERLLHERLLEIKTAELFVLLNISYKTDKLSAFFSSAISPQGRFMTSLMGVEKEAASVKELAERCHLSSAAFYRKFQEVFQVSPYKWMQERKTERVYRAIYETLEPLKEIAARNGFSSLSQMSDYCKKHIGMSPREIRKRRNLPLPMK